MKLDKKIKLVLLTVLVCIISTLIPNIVKAASVSISASTSTVSANQSFTVTIASDATGRVNLSATNASISANEVWIEDGNKSITVTPNGSGDVTVTATPVNPMSLNGVKVYPTAASCTVKLKKEGGDPNPVSTTKSNVATLSNLGIKPNDFSGFRSNTYSYNAEVPNETEKIEIYASKGQSGQKISGTGTKTLKEGVNTFNIVVIAEDGKTQKTYTINVTRKAKDDQSQETNEQTEENTEENTEEQPEEVVFGLSELKIEGYELEPQFQTDVYEYRIDLKEDLEKLDITTLATEANSNIEIVGNENFEDGENIITIVVKGENEEKVATYQIVVNKDIENKDDAINLEQDHQQMIKKIIAISIAGGLLLILVIAFIVVKVKKMKEPKQGYIPYENTFGDYKEDEIEEQSEELNDEVYEEKTRKKKHSKGKRFK